MFVRGDVRELPPAVHMAESLAARGHFVDVFTARPEPSTETLEQGVRYLPIPFDWRQRVSFLRRTLRDWRLGRTFLVVSTEGSYDLYWGHNITSLPWIPWAARRLRVPFVYQAHELVTWRECTPLLKGYYLAERYWVPRADLVVCPEPHRAALFKECHSLQETPMVVRNAMPLRERTATRGLRDFLAGRGRGAGRIVVYQGGYGFTKNTRALVEGFATQPTEDDLVFLGWANADQEGALKRFVASRDMEQRVHFHPTVPHEELWPLVCSADVGLVLYGRRTLNEEYAAPNKLGEYLMAGLAVIYTSCPGLDGLLKGRRFASPVEETTPRAFAAALSRYPQGAALEQAKEEARHFAEAEYNFGLEAAAVVARVETLVG